MSTLFSAGESVLGYLRDGARIYGAGEAELAALQRLEAGTAELVDLERLRPLARECRLPWDELFPELDAGKGDQ